MKSKLVLIAVLISVIFVVSCKKQETNADAKAPGVPVRAARVEQRTLTEEVSLTGTLKPQAQVQVVSEVPARLLRLAKDEGAWVNKGEVIAILDETDARLAHERAAAAVAVAQANREHALAERDRANNLLKTGGITDKDHLAAMVNLQVSEASLKQTKAEEAIAAQQLSRCRIRAPFSGKIAKRLVDVGTMLAVGTPVVQLVDNSVLEFRASVPSVDYERVRMGAPVTITVDAIPGFVTQGQITRVLPVIDERSRSFEVVARVSEETDLISGLFARARVKVRELKDALVVPPSSLLHDVKNPEMATLFVIDGDKAQTHQVQVGYEGVEAVQIKNGLKPGAMVVVDPPTTLASGAPVQIIGEKKER